VVVALWGVEVGYEAGEGDALNGRRRFWRINFPPPMIINLKCNFQERV